MLRLLRGAIWTLYGACALAVFGLLFVIAAVLVLAVPRLEWRRALVRQLARIALAVFGVRVTTRGLDRLPGGSCVVVANHSSYLDGIVLKAALPPRFSFVIKREAASMPVVGVVLKRIGSEFVDRHSQGGRQRDALRVLRSAEEGHSLVFFPEGTFDEQVGLKRFHVGAFAAAARGGMPVVPTVIRGARRLLPPGSLVPRPGRIVIEVLESVPVGGGGVSAEMLRDQARRRILAQLDEPDLAHPPPVVDGASTEPPRVRPQR